MLSVFERLIEIWFRKIFRGYGKQKDNCDLRGVVLVDEEGRGSMFMNKGMCK